MDSNYESLVSSADVQAARARARSLCCARHALENSADKTLAWEARYLQTPVPISADEFVSQRLENIRESIKQELKGHHRPTITPRPAYRRSLNAANSELMSFREKFEEWKMTYDREIGKTKASLASMTPTLQGLGLAARIHKIAGKAADSLNGTPSKGETTPCNTEASTPRTLSETITLAHRELGSEDGMEPSLQPLHLDSADLLSSRDECPDFLDNEPGLLSERSVKLAELKEDIGVLTTIIEKKIFAVHVPNSVHEDDANVTEEDVAVDLCAWSEGALTARTIKMTEDIDAPPHHDLEAAAVEEATPDDILQTPPDISKKGDAPRIDNKADLGIDHQHPRPVNLRDNLIILAKQKGFTPVNEGVVTLPSERERVMTLLRQIYAPTTTLTAMQAPVVGEKTKPTNSVTSPVLEISAGTIQPALPVSESAQMSPDFGDRSGRRYTGELTTPKEKPTGNEQRVEDVPVAMPVDLARSPNGEHEQKSSIISVPSKQIDVDDVTKVVSEIRELVIGSYRNDNVLPVTILQ